MVSEGRALTVMMSIMTMAAVIRVKIPKGRRIRDKEPNTKVVAREGVVATIRPIRIVAAAIRVKIPKGRRIQAEEPNTEVVIIQAKPQLQVRSKG